ncbi:FAD-dependent oxidoreductase [Streptomyces sp. NPDC020299]|uniref:FAD-dependent oxidoreductase n=1 Tax=Streptomyces sp. NPDC020299 TaxID=3365067 RepID=UPI00378BFB08
MNGRVDGRPPGRDLRAQAVPVRPGTDRVRDDPPVAAVIGGGIAGLAAATVLAERGVRVVLYEREPFLGGRVAGWPVTLPDGSRATMSRGFHAFFRQYYSLRALLRRVDPALGMLTGLPDYPLRHSSGLCDSFRHVPRTPPWNALGFAALSPTFRLRDLLSMRPGSALPLLDVRTRRIHEDLDQVSADAFLDAVRFPRAARHLAFEVFSRSFFADPRQLSAAEMALMFHIYFLGSSEGLLFDVPREPFPTALWEPLAGHLARYGTELRTATPVEAVHSGPDGGHLVADATGSRLFDAVVLAMDTGGLQAVVSRSPGLGDSVWRDRVARLRTASPFLVSRLWLDSPPEPTRPHFLGTSGYGALDNVSVLSRWEGEATRWAARTGGSVVELHAYAVPPDTDHDTAERHLVEQLHRVYPETRRARVVTARHEWRADCPLFPVGGYAHRPTVRTPDPAVVVAGDLVRTDLPVALMERAATSGFLAANALLERWGVRGEVVWTVPDHGRSVLLRALASRRRPGRQGRGSGTERKHPGRG